jgi:hypothetical protein
MSLTEQMEAELRRLAGQLKSAGLRVYWFKGGEQIKVYSVTLDAFAYVWLSKPNHCWMYAMDIVPTRDRYRGFITMESARLHIAHVLEALKLAAADPQKRTNAMWRTEDKSMWELV